MGYVLPVDRYQYMEYQNRMPRQKLNVDSVNPPFKALLENRHEEITSEYERLRPSSYKSVPLKPQMSTVSLNLVADITGKGRAYNEFV